MSSESHTPRQFLARALSRVLKFSTNTTLVFAVIAALALNIATLTFVPAFNLLSSAIGAVAGVMTSKPVTIRSKHQGEIKSHKSQVASLNAEHTKKTNQLLQSHKDKVTSLKAKHSYEFNRLLKSYEVETKKLGSAVKKTIRRISQRVAKATARSIGSIAAESIPYIGIGVRWSNGLGHPS